MENKKFNPRESVVNNLINQLELNPSAWRQTWSKLAMMRPHNPVTGTVYQGVNMINLAVIASTNGFEDPRWCTYAQALKSGNPVKKGEQSRSIVVYHQITHQVELDGEKHIIKANGTQKIQKEIAKIVSSNYPQINKLINQNLHFNHFLNSIKKFAPSFTHDVKAVAMSSPVFNFSQLEKTVELNVSQHNQGSYEIAEQLIRDSGVKVIHDQCNKNYYVPATNEIHLTIKSAFETKDAYYSTILHELSHAKLNDKSIELDFDVNQYYTDTNIQAKEELRAELSSIFLCAEIGMNYDVQNHAAYLYSWLDLLKHNKHELWSAVADSNRVVEAIMSNQNDLEKSERLNPTSELTNVEQLGVIKLLNTKTNTEHEFSVSDFNQKFSDDIEKVKHQSQEIFNLLNPTLEDILDNWNSYSENWTSPQGVQPMYEFISYEQDNNHAQSFTL